MVSLWLSTVCMDAREFVCCNYSEFLILYNLGERNQKYLELKKREETMQGVTSILVVKNF
jgi:hypothetical protein